MNIQMILQKLVEQGMTDAEIGREVNAPQSIITRLRNGTHKSTTDERGQLIRLLAAQRGIDDVGLVNPCKGNDCCKGANQ